MSVKQTNIWAVFYSKESGAIVGDIYMSMPRIVGITGEVKKGPDSFDGLMRILKSYSDHRERKKIEAELVSYALQKTDYSLVDYRGKSRVYFMVFVMDETESNIKVGTLEGSEESMPLTKSLVEKTVGIL